MNKKIVEYLVVQGCEPFEMSEKVQKRIVNGYETFGSPYLFYENKAKYGVHFSVQAMVKYE